MYTDNEQNTALGFAIVATTFAVSSYFFFGWFSFLGLAFGITATVLGAKYHSKATGIAALSLGIISVSLSTVGVIIYIVAIATAIKTIVH